MTMFCDYPRPINFCVLNDRIPVYAEMLKNASIRLDTKEFHDYSLRGTSDINVNGSHQYFVEMCSIT